MKTAADASLDGIINSSWGLHDFLCATCVTTARMQVKELHGQDQRPFAILLEIHYTAPIQRPSWFAP